NLGSYSRFEQFCSPASQIAADCSQPAGKNCLREGNHGCGWDIMVGYARPAGRHRCLFDRDVVMTNFASFGLDAPPAWTKNWNLEWPKPSEPRSIRKKTMKTLVSWQERARSAPRGSIHNKSCPPGYRNATPCYSRGASMPLTKAATDA